MTTNETLYVLQLAEATSLPARRDALLRLARSRVGDAASVQLRKLAEEVSSIQPRMLRQLPSAVDLNTSLRAIPRVSVDPVLPPSLLAVLSEWVVGWERAEDLKAAGLSTPGPLLLTGPTGVGKTTVSCWLAGRLASRYPGVLVDAHHLVESHLGETGRRLSKAFEDARRAHSLVLLEEIDGLGFERVETRGSSDQENNRITIAMQRLLEQFDLPVIATTNHPQLLDPAFHRRFEYRVAFPVPTPDVKRDVLRAVTGLVFDLSAADLERSLVELVPMARRACRRAFLNDSSPGDELRQLFVGA